MDKIDDCTVALSYSLTRRRGVRQRETDARTERQTSAIRETQRNDRNLFWETQGKRAVMGYRG